jgi:anion-transporting  ArsA/GET3 family ATPase
VDPRRFCSQARVLIVAGKGGVGKTTVSATLARMAARTGLSTLIVEVEGKSGLAAAFGHVQPLTYKEVTLAPGGGVDGEGDIRARTLTPDDALIEYLRDHGMRRVSKRLAAAGLVEVIATAVPGAKDILVLGKVKQLERDGAADLIVLDAPAAGHAVSFLMSASGLLDAVRAGPIRAQARDVVDVLTDPARCQVLLVTLPEETPVNEVVETAEKLRDRVGVALAGVVVNGRYPALAGLDVDPEAAAETTGVPLEPGEAGYLRAAADFRLRRQALQASQVERLARALPLPRVELPFLFTTEVGPTEVDHLATALATSVARLPEAGAAP